VSSCCNRVARGGHLVLNAALPAPAGITATLDGAEAGGVSGRLLVTGAVRCNSPSQAEVDVTASQRVGAGANVARGSGGTGVVCGTQDTSWTVSVDSDTGWAFQVGTTTVSLDEFSFDGFGGFATTRQSGNVPVTGNPDGRSPNHVSAPGSPHSGR
jgi:hypothetical protein